MSTPVLITIAFVLLVGAVYCTPNADGSHRSLWGALVSTVCLTGVLVMVTCLAYRLIGGTKMFNEKGNGK